MATNAFNHLSDLELTSEITRLRGIANNMDYADHLSQPDKDWMREARQTARNMEAEIERRSKVITVVSDLELSGVCDVERLCLGWKDAQRFGLYEMRDFRFKLVGFILYSRLAYETYLDLDFLLDILGEQIHQLVTTKEAA